MADEEPDWYCESCEAKLNDVRRISLSEPPGHWCRSIKFKGKWRELVRREKREDEQ